MIIVAATFTVARLAGELGRDKPCGYIRQNRMDKFRKHVRLDPVMYEKGWYFLTLVAKHRRDLFINDQAKRILNEELINLPKRFLEWNVDETIIMPNHLHTIWWSDKADASLPQVVGAFKSLVSKRFREELGERVSPWQPNYYEHIIRYESELPKIRLYIRANPLEEKIDWSRMDDYL